MPVNNENLKRLNKLLRTISKINQQLIIVRDEKKLCKLTCKYLVEIKGFKYVWIGLKENKDDYITPIAISGKDKDFVKSIIKNSWSRYNFSECPTNVALKSRKSFVINDLKKEERFVPWDKEAVGKGFLSAIVLPLKYYGEVIGTLHIYSDIKNYFTNGEIKFLNEVAGDISIGIKSIRNENKLIESKIEYEELFKRMSSCVAIYEAVENGKDFIFKDINSATERVEKVKKEDIIGKNVLDVFPGVKDFGLLKVFKRVFKSGKSENFPLTFYKDNRISGWKENFVYKLPSGNIVTVYVDLTEKVQAEEEIKSLAKFPQENPHPVGRADYSGKVLYCNQACGKKLKGTDSGKCEYLSIPLKDAIKKITIKKTFDPEEIEFEIGERLFSFNIVPVENQDYVNFYGEDITDRKKAEMELQKSEESLKKAQHLAKIGSWEWTVATDTVIWSEELCLINGHDPKLPAPSFAEMASFYMPESWKKLNEAVGRALNNGESYELELDLIRTDGTIIKTVSHGEVIYDTGGKIVGLNGTVQDITERKKFEEALRESEENYRTLFITSGEGILIVDIKTHNIKYVNPAICQMFGYTEKELNTMVVADIHPKEDLQSVLAVFQDLIRGIYSLAPSIPCLRKDGTIFYADITNTNIIIDGQKCGAGFFRDITERKNKEAEILHLSYHDKLTGLYNRRFVEEEIKRLDTKRQLPLSVIMGDSNGLKLINDTFGHTEGDKVLKETAELLKKICRSEDILARWGGDEFVILLPKTSITDSEEIMQRIKKECAKLIIQKIPLGLAIGIATKIDVNQVIDEIVKEAESNMYKNKLGEKQSDGSSIIFALEQTLYEKSNETMEHALRLKDSAIKLGKSINLHPHQLDELSLLASLHDIGKVAIPETILLKEGRLEEKEWAEIKRHPEIGFNIAQASPQIIHIAKFILYCHENWDGSGYPQGLAGEEIPLLSRIMFIADAYDVMTNKRPYKKAMSKDYAIKELKRCAGTQFDPELVEKFIDIISKNSDKTG